MFGKKCIMHSLVLLRQLNLLGLGLVLLIGFLIVYRTSFFRRVPRAAHVTSFLRDGRNQIWQKNVWQKNIDAVLVWLA